jgi:hypothetical protein
MLLNFVACLTLFFVYFVIVRAVSITSGLVVFVCMCCVCNSKRSS